jgi:hypothetical protein
MARFLFVTIGLIGMFITASSFINNINAQEKETCIISITEPRNNVTVGRETTVKGKAEIPRGNYLWVLARRSDFKPLWWPQREAEIDPRTKKWSATSVFGGAQDIGWNFDIGVISVDKKGHTFLKDYWIKAMRTGNWKPIEMPQTSCPPTTIKVKKVKH